MAANASAGDADTAVVAGSDQAGTQADDSSQDTSDGLSALVSAADATTYRNQLLSGVSQIATVGAPGEIAVFDPPGAASGEGAFSVIHDGNYRSMVAAAVWGTGRIVAFGHNGYTNFSNVGNSLNTGQFYLNSVEWTTGSSALSVNIVTSSTGTRDWLVSQGFTNVSVHSNWENYLSGADLLIAELGTSVSAAKQTAVTSFVQSGGGLITGGTGWGYASLGYDLVELDGNQVLRQAGLAWADGFRSGTTNATRKATSLANATEALDFTQQLWSGGAGTTAQKAEAGEALQTVLSILPDDHPLAIDIADAFATRAAAISATPATPVSDSLDKAVLTWESNLLLDTPVDEVTAHHTAEQLYGAIASDAPRVTDTVTIDTSSTRWHATGLYAAPGEVVTITVPASLVGQGYTIRINAHTDNISQRDSWERMPVVHRSFEIDQTTLQVASAFGGTIFIDLGGNAYSAPLAIGELQVTIAGAIRQPYFVLGETTDQEWIDTLRDYPAPYAVFVSDNILLVQRSSESAALTQPTALMTWWNEAVLLEDELAARLEPRTGPEIINVDIQNSAGAAHSGFPIQAYDKHWGNLADYDNLAVEGSWGDFHELGHNHQRGWWTFDGDGEVTVNIFSNYVMESLASDSSNYWAYSTDPVETMQTAIGNVRNGGTYSGKSDRWAFWFQLADGFGFETYINVFAGYEQDNANNPSALPTTNAEEKDQWLVRWSNEVGYDMSAFMVDTWGLEVSQSALDAVASLPDWMPLATSLTDFQIDFGESQSLPAAASGLGMDGVATFVGVTTPPQFGTLTDNGDGTYSYTPTTLSGVDTIGVSYQSSAGNIQEFTLEVTIGSGFKAGDLNLDGVLNSADIAQFLQSWRSDTTDLPIDQQYQLGDLNFDGTTNFSDWSILRDAWNEQGGVPLRFSSLAASLQGDFDGNGVVEAVDYQVWKASFGTTSDTSLGGDFLPADANLDGSVDLVDYTVWRNHLGQSAEQYQQAAASGASSDAPLAAASSEADDASPPASEETPTNEQQPSTTYGVAAQRPTFAPARRAAMASSASADAPALLDRVMPEQRQDQTLAPLAQQVNEQSQTTVGQSRQRALDVAFGQLTTYRPWSELTGSTRRR